MADILFVLLVLTAAALVMVHVREEPPGAGSTAAGPPGAGSTAERLAHDTLFCMFTLLYKVAKADGAVSEGEVARIQDLLDNKFEIQRERQREVKELVQSWEADFSFMDLLHRLKHNFHSLVEPARARRAFSNAVELMFMVAASDGRIHPREERLIGAAAHTLDLSVEEYDRLRAQYIEDASLRRYWYPEEHAAEGAGAAPGGAEATGAEAAGRGEGFDVHAASDLQKARYYAQVLGLQGAYSREEVQKAYRDAVAKYHPDRVQHLGEELQRVAERKTKEINEAYTWLRQHHAA